MATIKFSDAKLYTIIQNVLETSYEKRNELVEKAHKRQLVAEPSIYFITFKDGSSITIDKQGKILEEAKLA
jgi:hypothetical protein